MNAAVTTVSTNSLKLVVRTGNKGGKMKNKKHNPKDLPVSCKMMIVWTQMLAQGKNSLKTVLLCKLITNYQDDIFFYNGKALKGYGQLESIINQPKALSKIEWHRQSLCF